jgi:hypothetical protein
MRHTQRAGARSRRPLPPPPRHAMRRTMGFPRKAEIKGFKRSPLPPPGCEAPSTASNAAAGEAGTAGRAASRQGGAVSGAKASQLVDTLKSRCPLKWACSELYPATSTYTSAFGSNPGRTPQVRRWWVIWGGCQESVLCSEDTRSQARTYFLEPCRHPNPASLCRDGARCTAPCSPRSTPAGATSAR